MVHTELRVVIAAFATFVALAGIAVSIHGLLFDEDQVTLSGVVAIGLGLLAAVALLNVWPRDKT